MSVEAEPFYANPGFWVGSAFIVFAGFAWYMGAFKKLTDMLDARGARIKAQLDEAQRLRDEAAALLAEYEAKQKAAEADAAAMLTRASEDAANLAKTAAADLDAMIARRSKMAADQIAQAEAGAIAEVRRAAVDIAATAAAAVVSANLDAKAQGDLNAAAIDEIGARLN